MIQDKFLFKQGFAAQFEIEAGDLDTVAFGAVTFNSAVAAAGATGLANDATKYYLTVLIDGVPYEAAITGSTAQTFATLATALNTALSAVTAVTFVDASDLIKFTNAVAYPVRITFFDGALSDSSKLKLLASITAGGGFVISQYIGQAAGVAVDIKKKATVAIPSRDLMFVVALRDAAGVNKVNALTTVYYKDSGILGVDEATIAAGDILTVQGIYA
jgi:hypothetical protein